MSWLDGILLIVLIVLIYFSSKRGIIVEFFDILSIAGAFCIGSFAKGPIADLFMKQFGWPVGMANWMGFLLTALPLLIIIFLIGAYVNDAFKIKLPPDFITVGGVFFGIIKALMIAWLFMTLISLIPGVRPETRFGLGKGYIVRLVNSGTPFVEQAMEALTPKEVGESFVKKIESSQFPKTMKEAEKQYKRYQKQQKEDLKKRKEKEKEKKKKKSKGKKNK